MQPPHLTRAPNLRASKTEGKGNRTNADNETGEVKNGCKSHQPQNWDRSEKVPFLTRAQLPRSRQRKRELRKGKRAEAQEGKASRSSGRGKAKKEGGHKGKERKRLEPGGKKRKGVEKEGN